MIVATLDLENPSDRALVGAEWRYAPGLVPGEPNGGLVDELPETPARLADYDDSGWKVIDNIQAPVQKGLCFGWYRIAVTLPEKVGGADIAGLKVWYATTIDDYGEVWIDGKIDLAFGQSGRGAASGFNAPQRVVVAEQAVPGTRHVIANLAVNGPFGRPGGGIFMRYARLEFENA